MNNIKQLVVVSGKGGTGKTSLVAALTNLFSNKTIADCDVDAANLHMILHPSIIETKTFTGGKKAVIDLAQCTACGICRDLCRFDAITPEYEILKTSCEGCGACYFFCPAGAIDFRAAIAGHCHISTTPVNDIFVYAEMLPGEDNSGKLVAMVREEARTYAESRKNDLIIIDGPPGIGCPVISSITGTHLAIAVTEPTASGIHDLERILGLAHHFQVIASVVINKSDINLGQTRQIRDYCLQQGVPVLGEIPYDRDITEAQRQGKSVLDYAPHSKASEAIRSIAAHIKILMEDNKS